MTCIVGLVEPERVWLGGDSCANCSDVEYSVADGKVFRSGEFLMGCSGSLRFSAVMRYRFQPPPLLPDADIDAYMATAFADEMRRTLVDSGHMGRDNEGMDSLDCRMLVAVRGRLYNVDGWFSALRHAGEFCAIGTGTNVALGSLHSTRGDDPRRRIDTALEAAATYAVGVAAPFTIEFVGENYAYQNIKALNKQMRAEKRAKAKAA